MAQWCDRCGSTGTIPGCFIPTIQYGKEAWIEIPSHPCVYCLGKGVFLSVGGKAVVPPDSQTS